MRVKLIKAYRDAFGDAYCVYVKVLRDKPEYDPWERVLGVSFKVLQWHNPNSRCGKWCLKSMTEGADKYMKERFGSDETRCFYTKAALCEFLVKIIPDWIGKDYSGGKEREFKFID